MTLRDLFERQYVPHRLMGKSPDTIRLFGVCFAQLDQFLGREALLVDLSDDLIRALMAWLIGRRRSIATANKSRAHLVALWNFAAKRGLVQVWPTVIPLTEPKRMPIAWTKRELAALWIACERTKGTIAGIPAPLWWHSLHALAWDSAERISALLGLSWNDVDLGGCWARFPAEIRKGRRADLSCRLHADTARLLDGMPRPSKLVLPWDRARTTLWLHYWRLRKRAGLPTDRKHAFHCMRKSVASYFEAAGGNATTLLGHSTRRVTEAYLDPRVLNQTHASDVLFRMN